MSHSLFQRVRDHLESQTHACEWTTIRIVREFTQSERAVGLQIWVEVEIGDEPLYGYSPGPNEEDAFFNFLQELDPMVPSKAALKQPRETTFQKELAALINRYSLEVPSDTPDLILARYLHGCLQTWNEALKQRDEWWDRRRLESRGSPRAQEVDYRPGESNRSSHP